MLDRVLNARSVAIVGASAQETKRGYQAIRTLIAEGYTGAIYPVNPKESDILGLPCYPDVMAIDGDIDLALLATPAASIPAILAQCGEKGVQGAIILAGGFGETGDAGRRLEAQVVAEAERNGIRLIGPNTSGAMNLKTGLNLAGIPQAPKGNIALLSQSGNMALTLMTEARLKSQSGFSYYVGVGNEADIKFHEYLAFFRDEPNTHAILMYVEGMREGRKFLEEAYQTTAAKPVILFKSGRSTTGARSAGSHTGALAGMSEVAEGAFKRTGVITIDTSDQLFPAADALSKLPPIKNNRVAVLADGGGHATIAADLLTDLGLELPPLSDRTQDQLRAILPHAATVTNPVDVAGGTDADPSLFADCARILLADPQVGGLLLVGLFGGYGIRFAQSLSLMEEDAAHQMGKLLQKRNKPIIVHSLFASEKPHSLDLLRYYRIPVHDSLDVAAKCIGVLAEYGRYLKQYHPKFAFTLNPDKKARPKAMTLIDTAAAEGRNALLEHEAKQLLREHGCAIAPDVLVDRPIGAAEAIKAIGGPVAMKIVSPDILHKSDAGGVLLNITSAKAAKAAFDQLMAAARQYNPHADIRGVLVSPMCPPGLEVIIGTKMDDQFGPVIMFGIGGILVEILKDVVFRVLPISIRTARKMIQEIRSAKLLSGFRGEPGKDQDALARLLVTVSELIESNPKIVELDLNPVVIHETGLSVVDARILLKE